MKSYNEIAQNVFKRRKEYLEKKKKRQRMLYYSITSLCVVVVLAVGLYLPNKPQEVILPHSHPQLSSAASSNSSCVDPDCSQVLSSPPLFENNSSIPNKQDTVTSLPKVEHQESVTVPGKPEAESSLSQQDSVLKPDSSTPSQTPDNSSSGPITPSKPVPVPPISSSPPPIPSTPEVQYKVNFSNLDQFSSFLPQLNIQIEPSQEVDTGIPEITTPEPSENFWDELNNSEGEPSAPGTDVGAKPNGSPTAPAPPSNKEIWDVAKNMFDNGYYNVPYLQNGNDLLLLEKIYIQKDTIKYNYKFHQGIPNAQSSHLLSVQLFDYSIKGTYESYLRRYDYKLLNYNGITYTAFRMDESNMYNACVIWEQNGFWCRANYLGDDMYLSSIIPNLYLVQLPWTQS